jgi:hypothetical protein
VITNGKDEHDFKMSWRKVPAPQNNVQKPEPTKKEEKT